MSYSAKISKILSFIMTFTIFFTLLPSALADEDYMFYKADFETSDENQINDFWSYISDSDKNQLTSSAWIDGGYVFQSNNGNHYKMLLDKDYSEKKTDESVIVWEARIKHDKYFGGTVNVMGSQCMSSNFSLFSCGTSDENGGLRIYGNSGYFAYSAVGGVKPSAKMTDYLIKSGEFYTYKIKWDVKNNKAQFLVSNETQGDYQSPWVDSQGAGNMNLNNVILCGSLFFYKTTADYLKIYDEMLLPKASFAESDFKGMKNGDKLTVNLDSSITQEILNNNPVEIDGGASIEAELCDDEKSIVLTLFNLKAKKKYNLTVPKLGDNLGVTAIIESADADYILYRAEFASVDSTEAEDFWIYLNESSKIHLASSSWIDGGYISQTNNSDHYKLMLDRDCSEKKTEDSVIVWEARLKYEKYFGETASVDGEECLNMNFPLFSAGSEKDIGGLRIYGNSGYFAYSSIGGVKPSEKMTDYPLKAGEFYTYRIKWDIKNNRAKFSTFNETQGGYESSWIDCTNTGDINFNNVILCGSLFFYKVTADYLRVYDEALIPIPSIIEGNADFINDGIVIGFPFEITDEMLNMTPITIDQGAELSYMLSYDKLSVEIFVSNTEAKKKYKIFIPALGDNRSTDLDVRQMVKCLDNNISDPENVRTDSQIVLTFSEKLSLESELENPISVYDSLGNIIENKGTLNSEKTKLTVCFPKGLKYNECYKADMTELFKNETVFMENNILDFKTELYPVYIKDVACSLNPLALEFYGVNNSGYDKNIKALVIYYDENNLMIGCEIKDAVLINGEKLYKINPLVKPEGTRKVNGYLFEDISLATPVYVKD